MVTLHTVKQTYRETHRQTDTQTHIHTDRQTPDFIMVTLHTDTDIQRDRLTDRQINRWTYTQTDPRSHHGDPTHRHADIQTDR